MRTRTRKKITALVERETASARRKHGRSFENGSDDRRARIMMEEIGEIAEALQRLENAQRSRAHRGIFSRGARLASAHSHLRSEIVQVASLCERWLEMYLDP